MSVAAKPKTAGKSKKRQAKKKEEEKRRLEEEEAEEENELQFQMACLEIRVKELETLNLGLRQKCNYLETQNDVFKVQLEETRDEKDDLVSHLTRKLSEQLTISKELEERLYGMQRARADDWKASQEKISERDQTFRNMKEKLEDNIKGLELRLASIDDFQQEKTTTEKNMKELEQIIETERQIHIAKYDELERKMILYREQVKNDAVETLVALAKDIQNIGKLSLNATIKSAIGANIQLNEELEKVSESNLELRSNLESRTKQIAEKSSQLNNLNHDKSIALRKCSQYKKVLELSLEKQVEMDTEIKSVQKIMCELEKLRGIHAHCKSDEEIQEIVRGELESLKIAKDEEVGILAAKEMADLIEELKRLEIIFINTSVVTRDMLQAQTSEELEFLKTRFKTMIVKIYETTCNFPNLTEEIKAQLRLPLPQITDFTKFGFT